MRCDYLWIMSAAISPQAFAKLPPYIQFQIIHHDDDRSATLEAIAIIGFILSIGSVTLRVLSRRVVGVRLEIDDWTIIAALVSSDSVGAH